MIRYGSHGSILIDTQGMMSLTDLIAIMRIIPEAIAALGQAVEPDGQDFEGIEALTLLHRALLPTERELRQLAPDTFISFTSEEQPDLADGEGA